jgi:hypothetical protein
MILAKRQSTLTGSACWIRSLFANFSRNRQDAVILGRDFLARVIAIAPKVGPSPWND